MSEKELLKKIAEIVFSVPDEMYKFTKPQNYFELEWEESSSKEKAYLLIYNLLIEENKKKQIENEKNVQDDCKVKLGKGPRFYSTADENMFFQAIYTLPSFIKIVGEGNELFLYYKKIISKHELRFLIDLLARYQVTASPELQNLYSQK